MGYEIAFGRSFIRKWRTKAEAVQSLKDFNDASVKFHVSRDIKTHEVSNVHMASLL